MDSPCDVVAEHGERAQGVQKILVEPRVRVRVGEATLAAAPRAVDPTAEPNLHAAAQLLSREKYGWGDGLIVELDPVRTRS